MQRGRFRRPAYTIVEFVIAIAVVVLLATVAIPRYGTYIRQQDFVASGQSVAGCLQRAQQAAQGNLGSTTPARFTLATLAMNPNANSLTCVYTNFPVSVNSVPVTVTSLLQAPGSTPLDTSVPVVVSSMVLGDTLVSPFRLVFGALENGAPLGYSDGGTVRKSPELPTNDGNYVPFGRGFTLTETANTLKLVSATDTSLCGIIVMGQLGNPIRFQSLSTCP